MGFCTFKVHHDLPDGGHVQIVCRFEGPVGRGGLVEYLAAAPVDRMTTFTGSALPAPSLVHAFGHGASRGRTYVDAGSSSCTITVPQPNRMSGMDGQLPPSIFVFYLREGQQTPTVDQIVLDGYHWRSLDHPGLRTQTAAMFYSGGWESLPIRTQEQILRSSAYNKFGHSDAALDSYWGLRPRK
jgi:hypothetical protein